MNKLALIIQSDIELVPLDQIPAAVYLATFP